MSKIKTSRNHTCMRFCQTVGKRSFENLWHVNITCDRCFKLSQTWIGSCSMWLVTVEDPLASAMLFGSFKDYVILVDFSVEEHVDLGGTFPLIALTTEHLECYGFMDYTT